VFPNTNAILSGPLLQPSTHTFSFFLFFSLFSLFTIQNKSFKKNCCLCEIFSILMEQYRTNLAWFCLLNAWNKTRHIAQMSHFNARPFLVLSYSFHTFLCWRNIFMSLFLWNKNNQQKEIYR